MKTISKTVRARKEELANRIAALSGEEVYTALDNALTEAIDCNDNYSASVLSSMIKQLAAGKTLSDKQIAFASDLGAQF